MNLSYAGAVRGQFILIWLVCHYGADLAFCCRVIVRRVHRVKVAAKETYLFYEINTGNKGIGIIKIADAAFVARIFGCVEDHGDSLLNQHTFRSHAVLWVSGIPDPDEAYGSTPRHAHIFGLAIYHAWRKRKNMASFV